MRADMTKEELHELRQAWASADDYYRAARDRYMQLRTPETAEGVTARHNAWDDVEDSRLEMESARIRYERAALDWARTHRS